MSTVEVDGDRIVFEDAEVELRHPVGTTLRVDDVVVVQLAVPVGTGDIDNVLGFSTDGERLWEIDNPVSNSTGIDRYQGFREEDGELWAISRASAFHRIDPETGEIVEEKRVK
ncbi:hypothetical protein BRD00_01945 [Halobacteriales archaeon QS_8_69_26]|nr:MAG: hypothetical protein BRD00_01945 [Halobacteriales archaeon QS_8_69_26]